MRSAPLVGAALLAFGALVASTSDVFRLEAQLAAARTSAATGGGAVGLELMLTVETLRVLLSIYLLAVALMMARAFGLTLAAGPAAAALAWDWANRLLLAGSPAGLTRGLLVLVLLRLAVRWVERALGLDPAGLADWLFLAGAGGLMLLALVRTINGLAKPAISN
jgi:hypothetical protein